MVVPQNRVTLVILNGKTNASGSPKHQWDPPTSNHLDLHSLQNPLVDSPIGAVFQLNLCRFISPMKRIISYTYVDPSHIPK